MAKFDYTAVVDRPTYSSIDLSYESIYTLQMGIAYPLLHKNIIPGDSFSIDADHIMRLAPLQAPIYDDVELHLRAFFTPNRILDPEWKKFITAGEGLSGSSEEIENLSFSLSGLIASGGSASNPDSSYPVLITDAVNGGRGSLADFLNFHFAAYTSEGKPAMISKMTAGDQSSYLTEEITTSNITSTMEQEHYDLLPFIGYWKIYDDWYRNERIQRELVPVLTERMKAASTRVYTSTSFNSQSSIPWSPFDLFRVNYSKDRYTTALPEPIVGGPVNIPVGDDPRLSLYTDSKQNTSQYPIGTLENASTATPGVGGFKLSIDRVPSNGSVWAQLTSAAQATIQQLKLAFKQYNFFMKDTYNGNRYVEFMDSHYDVRVPDATVDRAIYLGQQKIRISFGEVFQTSSGDGASGTGVLGDYAGRGASYSQNADLVNEKFLEHGQLYVIGSIVPRAKYYQGVDRKFFKKSRFDYFFPEFQDIGDDELYTDEIFYNPGFSAMGETFGFNARWAHLKESLDEVHGDFLDNMDFFHFGRRFLEPPIISTEFSSVPSINDPFSVTDEFSENYLANFRWNIKAGRPIKLYETF